MAMFYTHITLHKIIVAHKTMLKAFQKCDRIDLFPSINSVTVLERFIDKVLIRIILFKFLLYYSLLIKHFIVF